MHVETDLERIRQLAEERDEENWEFRTFLRERGQLEVDACVHRILDEVQAQVDCAACMNCCKVLQPTVTDAEIEQLSKALSISVEDFRRQYIERSEVGESMIRGLPCPFLEGNRCGVKAQQPESCREFPYLHKDGFTFRLMGVISNYAVCPIVFNVYERLKRELHWRPRRRR